MGGAAGGRGGHAGPAPDVMGAIGALWEFLWNCDDIAGNEAVVRAHAGHYRGMQAELRSLSHDLHGSITTWLSEDNWNDKAGQAFHDKWGPWRKELDDLATSFGAKADALEGFADQVKNFNDNFHMTLGVIAGCMVVMGVTTWVPVVNLFTDSAAAATATEEADTAWNLVNMVKGVLQFLRSNFLKIVFNFAKSFRLNYVVSYFARWIERGFVLGDPTYGWSQYDIGQLMWGTALAALPAAIIPLTPVGAWSALPSSSPASLPWGQFGRYIAVRIGQMVGLTLIYTPLNKIVVQGNPALDPKRLVELGGSELAAVPGAALVAAGSLVAFVISGGTAGLAVGLTIPTLVGTNTFLDVGIPGVSPLIRGFRGLVYLPPPKELMTSVAGVAQNVTGINGQLPTWKVKPGDTLQSIALAEYGNADDANYIAQANHLTGGVYDGETLVLPALPPGVH